MTVVGESVARNTLPTHLLGLVVVTCWLDQFNREGGGEIRFPPRVIGRTVARHPSPAAFGAVDETAVHRALTDYLDVQVKDGWVTLKGNVDHQFQSDKAFDHVASLYGVTGVTNEIQVVEQL